MLTGRCSIFNLIEAGTIWGARTQLTECSPTHLEACASCSICACPYIIILSRIADNFDSAHVGSSLPPTTAAVASERAATSPPHVQASSPPAHTSPPPVHAPPPPVHVTAACERVTASSARVTA